MTFEPSPNRLVSRTGSIEKGLALQALGSFEGLPQEDDFPVVVGWVFEEVGPNLTRISLRSKSEKVDVNAIAAQFGGGGHVAAAGARIPGKPLSAQRKVIAALKKALNSAKG